MITPWFSTTRRSHSSPSTRRSTRTSIVFRALLFSLVGAVATACGGESATTAAAGAISTITVSPQTLTLGVGSSVALEVALLDAAGQAASPRPVFWSSSDATIARVSASGVVTAVATGSVQVSATVQGKSAVATVLVAPTAVASVQLSSVELRLTAGDRTQLTASARDASGGLLGGRVVVWSVGNATVVVVDSTGAVTALAPGGTTVTATIEGRAATAAVFVSAVPVATIGVTPANTSIVEGQTTQLRAETRSATNAVLTGRTVIWTSTNAAVASVSSSGLVTGVSTGTTTITASSEGRTATAAITITARPVNGIVVSPSQLSLIAGQSVALSVQITDAGGNVLSGRAVTYRSENTSVAQVTANGAVTAVASGNTTITVTSEGRSASVNVVVSAVPVASIRVTPDQSTLTVGDDTLLTAVALDASGGALNDRAITWSSGAPTVATVSSLGVVTAVGVGSVIILAQAEGRTGSASITVRAAPIATVSIAPAAASITVSGTVDLVPTIRDANGVLVLNRAALWSSSAPAVAAVSSSGRVTALSPGTSVITASVDGRAGTAQITVSPAAIGSVTIAPGASTLSVGGTVELIGTVRDVNGVVVTGRSITWSSSAPAVASVSNVGVVTAIAPGTSTMTGTVDGKTGTAQITVSPIAIGSVTIAPGTSTLSVGGTVDLVGTVRDVNGVVVTGRTLTWSSSAAAVATVSNTGRVTAITAGTSTITGSVDGKVGTAQVTVSPAAIGTVSIAPSTSALIIGSTVDLVGTVRDVNGVVVTGRTITWSSSAAAVATVSNTGRVTAVSAGTSTITGSVDGKVGTAQITVSPAAIGTVSIAPGTSTLNIGSTVDLVGTVRDVNGVVVTGRSITWSSSAAAVATVSNTGRVTAVSAGTSTITATVDGTSGTAQITVAAPVVQTVGRVDVSPTTVTLRSSGSSNRSVRLEAAVYADVESGGGLLPDAPVVWSTSAPLVASVSSTGFVIALSEGTAIIRATSGLKSGTSTITVIKR